MMSSDPHTRTDYRNQIREALPDPAKTKRTICEVHRELYDRLDELGIADDDVAIKYLEDAYQLGKKMDAKLRQYNLRKGDDWYAAERDRIATETLVAERIARRKARQLARKAADDAAT
ncbi:MAG TPA: hypothetical protein VGK73_17495 [Polyangiaceae bacterium]